MVNTEMLNEAIRESGLKRGHIADAIGVSRASLARKMTGKTEFTASEIVGLTSVLQLTRSARDQIFLQAQ